MATVIATILIFLIMISLHEFGHFLFGKILGFNVLEYSIGFGPAIIKKQGKKTLYSIRIIPFGGYCKFAGEDGEDSGSDGDFSKQPCLKRIIVLAAGAGFNILLGFVVFVIFWLNVGQTTTNVIKSIVPNSYMEQTGLREGDKIIEINGKHVDFYNDIQLYSQDFKQNEEIHLTVKRGREKVKASFLPTEQIVKTKYFEDYAEIETIVNGVTLPTETASYREGFRPESDVLGKEITQTRLLMGFNVETEDISLFNIVPQSYYMTKFVVKLVYKTVWDMITGNVGVDQLSGPVGVVTVVNEAVKSERDSLVQLLNLMALLTINLGIFNLLPLPALDGGRILFVLIELIRRKPIPPEKEGIVHSIGFLLLILLMVFVCYQDILKLFSQT